MPIPGWLVGELRDFTHDVLAPARLRRLGLLDPAAVGRLVTEHMTRRADHSRAIWALLVLVLWYEAVQAVRPAVGGEAPRRAHAADGRMGAS